MGRGFLFKHYQKKYRIRNSSTTVRFHAQIGLDVAFERRVDSLFVRSLL